MASTQLTRTNSSTATSTTKATLSVWVKRATANEEDFIIYGYQDAGNRIKITFLSNAKFQITTTVSASNNLVYETNRLFRDVNSWYHIVVAIDTTLATAGDRVRLYINGVEETSFSTETHIGQNTNTFLTANGLALYIGSQNASNYFDGSMAHFHIIDGTQYTASDFGETDATTGIWKPKTAPSVTYGTNGFFLKFENSGSMGTDSSGNANNFTVNGTMTQTIDTPSNVFATLNPLNTYPSNPPVLSNGNTTVVTVNADPGYWGASSTLGASSGKYYWEVKPTNSTSGTPYFLGVSYRPEEMARNGATSSSQYTVSDWLYYAGDGNYYNNSTGTSYGNTYTTNDIIGVALDLDNSKLYFAKNGTWQNSGDPTSGATGTGAISITNGQTYFAVISDFGGGVCTYQANFGNGYFGTTAVSSAQNPSDGIGIFEYTVPTGYKALCTKSINAQEYA